jgi:hypothetical protein
VVLLSGRLMIQLTATAHLASKLLSCKLMDVSTWKIETALEMQGTFGSQGAIAATVNSGQQAHKALYLVEPAR